MFDVGKSKSTVISHKLSLWPFFKREFCSQLNVAGAQHALSHHKVSTIFCVWREGNKQRVSFYQICEVFKLSCTSGCTFHSTNKLRLLLDLPMTWAYGVITHFSYLKTIDQNKINKMNKIFPVPRWSRSRNQQWKARVSLISAHCKS